MRGRRNSKWIKLPFRPMFLVFYDTKTSMKIWWKPQPCSPKNFTLNVISRVSKIQCPSMNSRLGNCVLDPLKSLFKKNAIITCLKEANIFLHVLFLSQITNKKHKAKIQKLNLFSIFKAKMDDIKHPEPRNRMCFILSYMTLNKPLAHIERSWFPTTIFALGKLWKLWK